MACFKPLQAYRLEGQAKLAFSALGRGDGHVLQVPCGQCVGCRLERSRQWAVRVMHEAQMHGPSSFVTLTYRDDAIPYGGTLHYRHFQLFMKRLIKRTGRPVRFFMCGEYGEKFRRPHYHAILYGVWPSDLYPWRKSSAGFQLYRSPMFESVWDLGQAEVGHLSFESAAYVARYCMKKVTGEASEDHYRITVPDTGEVISLVPEFAHMSLKPGIGAPWYDKYVKEVFPRDYVRMNGVSMRPPKYYDRRLASSAIRRDRLGGLDDAHVMRFHRFMESGRKAVASDIAYDRFLKAEACAEDNLPDRLAVREIVTRARLSFKPRSLE